MKIKTLCALLLSSAAALEVESGVHIPQSNREDPNPEDDNLSTVLSTALAGAKPGVIKEPTAGKGDKEGDKQVTVGLTKNYKFHWKYACAFTKWVPSNQFLHAGQNYNPATMTLERFGFIGMNKKCFWGMVGVEWLTPLKVNQILPGTKAPKAPKPPAAVNPAKGSKILTAGEAKSLMGIIGATKLTPLYDASRDGWSKASFTSKVEKKGRTVHVVQADNGAIIGGVVPTSLPAKQTKDKNAWIFYIKDGVAHKIVPITKGVTFYGKPDSANPVWWANGFEMKYDANKTDKNRLYLNNSHWQIPKKFYNDSKTFAKYILGTKGIRNDIYFKAKAFETYAF